MDLHLLRTLAWLAFVPTFLTSAPSYADKVALTESLPCGGMYRTILAYVAQGKSVLGSFGRFSEMREIMLAAGVPEREIANTQSMINKILEYGLKSENPVLHNTVERIVAAEDNQKKLLVCFLSNECSMAPGSRLFPNPGGFPSTPKLPTLMVLGGKEMRSSEFIVKFLEDGAHFADYELMKEWIDANRAFLKSGLPPDKYFKRFVTLIDDRVQVDEGFERVFMESRSHNASAEAYGGMLPPAAIKSFLKVNRKRAINQIQEYSTITAAAVADLGVEEESIFEVGIRLGRTMEDSANALKKAKELEKTLENMNLYQVLELRPSASQNEIKDAYRRLSKKYHPDHFRSLEAEPMQRKINQAYDTLTDPAKHDEYDRTGNYR